MSPKTPTTGYLLCANNKTKAVTFPNKLSCPAGTKALDLGANTGVEGPSGPAGPQGVPGSNGKDAIQKSGYVVKLKPQDVIASVESESEKTIISKSGFEPGHYNFFGEISFVFQNSTKQVVLCNTDSTGESIVESAFPSHEVANTWKAHTTQVLGLVKVSSKNDILRISCNFTGNTRVDYGYLSLTPIGSPSIVSSD